MSEKRVDIFKILNQEGKLSILYVYPKQTTIADPYEKNKSAILNNPLPVKASIREIGQEALRWKYYGQIPSGSIEIIVEKKYKTLFLINSKIKYNGNYFKTWKDDSKGFALLEKQDYIVIILEKTING